MNLFLHTKHTKNKRQIDVYTFNSFSSTVIYMASFLANRNKNNNMNSLEKNSSGNKWVQIGNLLRKNKIGWD